jgi:hypothetical protein
MTLSNRRTALIFAAILVVYAALLLPTLNRQGISWDEQNDLWIARAYLAPDGWFTGSQIDLSQARLPMFSVALVYRLLGTADLFTGRWVSAVAGALTLLGIYIYGSRRFSPAVGVLSAGLLAISPFFLTFARVAFTETDIYLACALTWLLVCIDRLQNQPALGTAALAGVVFGLAVSAKATALAVLPAIWLAAAQPARSPAPPGSAGKPIAKSHLLLWAAWMAFVLLAAWNTFRAFGSPDPAGSPRGWLYALVCLGWLLPLAWAAWQRRRIAPGIPAAAFITMLGLLTFFVIPPEHFTNPAILDSLNWRLGHEMAWNPAFMGEAAALHLLCIGLKSTPLIGLGLIASVPLALSQWKSRPELRLPLLAVLGYLGGLLLLPIAQTFYSVPVLPALSLLAADQFLRLRAKRPKLSTLLGWVTLVWWAVELAQCYPDYNLNGYQWVGARPLFGRSSIGYRSVAMTPSDGVQQAVDWLNAHAAPGETALLYVMENHIVQAFTPDPAYTLRSGSQASLNTHPDYVVVHINAILWLGWGTDTPRGDVVRYPYDPIRLGRDFEKVFSVRRAFGLEMASVWKRK